MVQVTLDAVNHVIDNVKIQKTVTMIKPALTRVANVNITPTSAPLVDIQAVSVVDQVNDNAVAPLVVAAGPEAAIW